MKRIIKNAGIVLAWIGTIFFGFSAIIMWDFCSLFFALLALNMLPIQKWKDYKKNKLKIGKALSIIIGIVLFFIGMVLVPPSDENQLDALDRNVSTSEINKITNKETLNDETTDIVTTTVPKSSFSIQYINVEHGDAAIVECDDHYMLIDGGDASQSSKIYTILKNLEVENLDIIVASHEHEDHSGGLAGALVKTTADLVLTPNNVYNGGWYGEFLHYAELNGNGAKVPNIGDVYTLGSATIEILGVNSLDDTSDINNSSIVLMITYGETKFLFTGDAEHDAEQVIIESGANLSCDVLKVAHHGSDNSTSDAWLNATSPDFAIISVAQNNEYAHPDDAVLYKLRNANVKTYRTDLNGDIKAVSDGKNVTITTKKEATDEEIYTSGQLPTEPPTEAPKKEIVTEPITHDYVINTNTGKFHYSDCRHAKQIQSNNRWDYTGTRDSLTAQGYEPCAVCSP